MTIAMGFRCVDGIMLCADTQETFSGYLKKKQPKLDVRGDLSNEKPCAVFAGAGDGNLVDMLVDKLWEAMEPKGATGVEAMIAAAEDEIVLQYQKLVPVFPTGMPDAALLIGVWSSPNDFELIKTSGPILNRRIILDAIGCGDILATYLTSRLLYSKSWLQQAIPVGIYVVDQVKAFVEGCGGETQLATINSDTGKIEVHDPEFVQTETERLRGIDSVARSVVGLTMGSFRLKEHFESLLNDTCKPLYQLAKFEIENSESEL